jgi:hypothetical protein
MGGGAALCAIPKVKRAHANSNLVLFSRRIHKNGDSTGGNKPHRSVFTVFKKLRNGTCKRLRA